MSGGMRFKKHVSCLMALAHLRQTCELQYVCFLLFGKVTPGTLMQIPDPEV
jgi:hypothetical protein